MPERILNRIRDRTCWLAVLGTFACAVHAAPDDGRDAAPATAAAPAKRADAPAFGRPADPGELERARGGSDTHNDTKLSGIVSGNSAVNVVTGNNVIDAGSFANMSGIPVVIQNSGANVLIQNSTVVNLQLK